MEYVAQNRTTEAGEFEAESETLALARIYLEEKLRERSGNINM